jgi:L-lactate permease
MQCGAVPWGSYPNPLSIPVPAYGAVGTPVLPTYDARDGISRERIVHCVSFCHPMQATKSTMLTLMPDKALQIDSGIHAVTGFRLLARSLH